MTGWHILGITGRKKRNNQNTVNAENTFYEGDRTSCNIKTVAQISNKKLFKYSKSGQLLDLVDGIIKFIMFTWLE